MPLNLPLFSTKDESGDFAKERWCYLTDIFRLLLSVAGSFRSNNGQEAVQVRVAGNSAVL